jgi:hypothetical protein
MWGNLKRSSKNFKVTWVKLYIILKVTNMRYKFFCHGLKIEAIWAERTLLRKVRGDQNPPIWAERTTRSKIFLGVLPCRFCKKHYLRSNDINRAT